MPVLVDAYNVLHVVGVLPPEHAGIDLEELADGKLDCLSSRDHLAVGIVALAADERLGVDVAVDVGERRELVQQLHVDGLDADGEQVGVLGVFADAVVVREAGRGAQHVMVARQSIAIAVGGDDPVGIGGARGFVRGGLAVHLLVVDVRGDEERAGGGLDDELVRGEVGADGVLVDERVIILELVVSLRGRERSRGRAVSEEGEAVGSSWSSLSGIARSALEDGGNGSGNARRRTREAQGAETVPAKVFA